jgi:integrating conjugative element membrane protein (TIGR03747 family)
MAEEIEKRQTAKAGFFQNVLTLPLRLLWIVMFSMLLSIVIEWLGMAFDWWVVLFDQAGSDHAYQTMKSEMGWIDTSYKESLFFKEPAEVLGEYLSGAYDFLFVRSGVTSFIDENIGGVSWVSDIAGYLKAMMYVVLTTLVRLMILFLTSPLFVMAALVGFVDGLVRRDLRKAGAGGESAFIYHHAKRLVAPSFVVGWLLYLSMPFSIHPNWFLLPNAFIFGLFISVASGSFKKYL